VNKFFWWTSLIIYMALIYYSSSLSEIKPIIPWPYTDKLVHAVEYGIFSVLIYFALRSTFLISSRSIFMLAFSLTLIYGLSDEIHQLYVPGRNCSGRDLLADGVGSYLSLMVIRYFLDKGLDRT
jgi:VanZ family protein